MKGNKTERRAFCAWLLIFFSAVTPAWCDDSTASGAQLVSDSTLRSIQWAGDNPPSDNDYQLLLVLKDNHDLMASFAEANPNSSWTPALRNALAGGYRYAGRNTLALQHWDAVMDGLRGAASPAAGEVFNHALAGELELLSSLGRVDRMRELLAVASQRQIIDHNDTRRIETARESFQMMVDNPAISFRCGSLALANIARAEGQPDATINALVEEPSTDHGISLARLMQLNRQLGLGLIAVKRSDNTPVPVPAVVHWSLNHYGALLEYSPDLGYKVVDPTFGKPRWISAADLDAEASGYFMVPQNQLPASWQGVTEAEAATVFGRGYPYNINDAKDTGCKRPPTSPFGTCQTCQGMPVWSVSEPYENVWVQDAPMAYTTSRGEQMEFRAIFKQRDSMTNDFGYSYPGFLHNWYSKIHIWGSSTANSMPNAFTNWTATHYLASGGEVDYSSATMYDAETHTTIQPTYGTLGDSTQYMVPGYPLGNTTNIPSAGGWYDTNTSGFRIFYPDGSVELYGFIYWRTNATAGFYESEALLTDRYDPLGNDTHLNYECFSGCSGDPQNMQYRLKNVVDDDGKTTSFSYYSSSPGQLQTITSPYGQTATFTNISSSTITVIDAVGNNSTIYFNTNGSVQYLVTPYGTTSFTYYQGPTNDGEGNDGGHNRINRAVTVVDANGGTNLYIYRFDCSGFMGPSVTVPSGTPLGTLDGGTNSASTNFAAVSFRNSFHWEPMQTAALSTMTLTNLGTNDYVKAEMRHWLGDSNDVSVVDSVSIERRPAADGTNAGQQTFYDYAGKTLPFLQGTSSQIAVIARTQPSGTTEYDWKQYNSAGLVTQDVSTYSSNSFVGTRTNSYTYATNTIKFKESSLCQFCVPIGGPFSYAPLAPATNRAELVYPQGAYGQTNNVSQVLIPNLLVGATNADLSHMALDNYVAVSYSGSPTISGETRTLTGSFTAPLPQKITNEVGYVTTLFYDAANRLAGIAEPSGLHVTNRYNAGGFLTNAQKVEIGWSNVYSYSNGLVAAWTNELGMTLANSWDNLQRLTGVVDAQGFTSNTYRFLDISGARDRLGNWTYYGHNPIRQLTAVTNANQGIALADYCQCGALMWVRDPMNNYTYFNYDLAGRQTNVLYPDGRVLNRVFNAIDQLTQSSDAVNSQSYTYNLQGLLTGVTTGAGQVSSTVFDVMDNPVGITDANGVTTTAVYDALKRPLTNTVGGTLKTTYGYATNGLIRATNAAQGVTSYANDAAGRVQSVTNANLQVSQYLYTPAGAFAAVIDGLGHSNTWSFNQLGWMLAASDTQGTPMVTNSYDADGRIKTRWMPASGTTTYSFDAVGNLTNIAYPGLTISYGYDSNNLVNSMSDAIGTTTFTHTQTGLLATESGPWSSDTLTYSYNQGYRTNLNLSQPSGSWNQSYSFDSSWRLQALASPAGTFAYTPGGAGAASPLTKLIALPNGAMITNHYDSLARMDYTGLLNQWSHPLDSYSYLYDPRNLRTNIVRQLGLSANVVTNYFDGIGQITAWNGQETNGTLRQNEQLAYSYDAANNLNTRTSGALVQTFTPNALNQINTVSRTGTFTVTGATPAPATNVTVNGSVAQTNGDFTFASTGNTLVNGNNSFTVIAHNVYGLAVTNNLTVSLPTNVTCQYDANGNLTNDGTRWFYYDAENQLTNVTVSGQWQVLFGYDGLNRRRYESNFTWQSGNWTLTNAVRFIYDGMQILQERDTGNNPMVTYTRGPDLSMTLAGAGGIGGLLARTDANGSTCYHADAAGNITALTDANQNIVARYEYDAFGRLIGFWGTMGPVNRMRFSSKRHVTQADLYDFGYRWYPPNLQRWLTRDPLGIIAGLNPYTFSGNGSINQIDPYGHANWFTRLGDAIVSPISDLMVGAAEFNGVTSRNSQLAGNGYVNQQDLDISSKHFNCVLTAGNLDAVGAAGRIAAGATGLYLNAIPSILTGGLSAPETAFLGAEEDSVLAAGESALVSDNTAQLGYSLASDLAPAAETAAEDSLTLYHGTTANAAGSILDGGFRAGADNAVFFGEDFATARYFGEERIAETGASSGQVLRYTVPQSLAEDIGLAERHVLGEFRGAPPIDIPHASGFERILQGGNIGLFNQAVRSGQIAVKVFRIGY